MSDELTAKALEKLLRALGDDADTDEARLQDALDEAEAEICLFLGVETMPETLLPKAVALAACYVQRDTAAASGAKSASFTEGKISGSETYYGPEEYTARAEGILDSLRRWRVARVRGGSSDED
ncbi:MAG: hypothetical protein LUH36_05880 [Oscillospiraceae bacterium]|nr:hypothetical protein [Oscillospiraceae bacterium]